MASGDAAESAQMVAGAAERRARDIAIRTAFADPATRHHEAVAEAELDVDYADSPIVAGDRSDAAWPGQRLPDRIEVRFAAGGSGMLHDYANRRGHTALLIGGASATRQDLKQALHALKPLSEGSILESTIALAANVGVAEVDAYLKPETAERLGVGDITLLVVRPDGHVGLRAEANHAQMLAAYIDLLRRAPA
jgi:hypothetical protein